MIFGGPVLLKRALHYEVNASVFAVCGKLSFLHVRTVGHLFAACGKESRAITLDVAVQSDTIESLLLN